MTEGTTTGAATSAVGGTRTAVLDPARLVAGLSGRLISPDDADWDAARLAWNLAVDQRPALVVEAETVQDVVATIEFARSAGLRVAPQGTGHGAAMRTDLMGTLLLRTDRMREVTVDPDARTVRVGAGVPWQEVTEALAPYGLVALAGSSGDVGVVGYLLGGGYSWLARQYGLGCSSVTAVELVTGDGRFRRVDAHNDPELFWAVRGGSGNAAVVTAIEFAAYPAALVYAGSLLFPIERAREVLTAYAQWTRELDERATTCVRLLRIPPLPEIPEPVRGRSFVGVTGCIDLPAPQAEALLAPLRDLAPALDMFGPMPGSALGHINMDPPQPTPAASDGLILTDLAADTIEALLQVAGPAVESPLLAVDLRHVGGGAAARPAPDGGALDHLPGRYMVFAVGITPVPAAAAAVAAALNALTEALQPWTADRDFPNFREVPVTANRFYEPEVLARLRAVQQRVDPQCVVRAGHEWAA